MNKMKKKLIILSTMTFTFFSLTGIGQAQLRLSLKATGGYGTISPGDINAVINSKDNMLKDLARIYGYTKEGALEKINWGLNFEGEFILNLTDNIGIGLGSGYIQRKKSSTASLTIETMGTINNNGKPNITAIPIKISVYYFYPVASRMNVFLKGGIGYYFGKITLRLEEDIVSTSTVDVWQDFKVKDNGIGFHGGLGFEYNIVQNIAFFVEGEGRYAKLKDWKGDMTYKDWLDQLTEKRSGTFWYYEFERYGKYYSDVDIREDKPTDSHFKNLRKFECNFSAFSLKVGIRIKL